MSKKLNILFLGGGKRTSLAERFLESGRKMNLKVNIFSYEISNEVPINSMAKIIIGLKWNDPKIYSNLLKVIKKFNISLIIANVDQATIVLSKLYNIYPNLNLISSDHKICKILFNKLKTFEICKKNNIKTIPMSNKNFPMYVKLITGSASKGGAIIRNLQEYNYFFKENKKSKYIKQKFLNGIEYSVDAYISKKGIFMGAIPRIRENITDGESTKTKIVIDNEIVKTSREICTKLNLKGPITLQFIRFKKKLFFLEINPRFGGGAIASIEAGLDIPTLMIKDYFNLSIKKLSKYKNLVMTRSYRETFHKLN